MAKVNDGPKLDGDWHDFGSAPNEPEAADGSAAKASGKGPAPAVNLAHAEQARDRTFVWSRFPRDFSARGLCNVN